MNYTDFNNKMEHDGKRNNRYVEVTCTRCEEKSWQRWQRVKKKLQSGSEFFCSRECHTEYQRENAEHIGYKNARMNFDKSRGVWYAYWWEDGVLRNTTASKWLWEMEYGPVPDGYVVTYIDRNPENCVLENLEIVTRGERTSEALQGHYVSEETKQKISDAHKGKILSDEHRLNISNSLRRRWNSGEFGDIHVGENSKFWRGGVDPIYPEEFNDNLKQFIRERDKFRCRICLRQKENDEKEFHIHHIDADKSNTSYSNLITVCPQCHGHIHGNHKIDSEIISAFRSMLKY